MGTGDSPVQSGGAPQLSLDERQLARRYSVSEELHHARPLGLSVALGAAMGAALGAATGHMGVWVVAGIAAYIAISLAGGAWNRKPND